MVLESLLCMQMCRRTGRYLLATIQTIWTGQSMRGRWSSVYSFVLLRCHCVFTTQIHFETYVCITNLTTVYNKK